MEYSYPKYGMGKLAREYGHKLALEILSSYNGFYIGTSDESGPVSRESLEYYSTKTAALNALENKSWSQRTHI